MYGDDNYSINNTKFAIIMLKKCVRLGTQFLFLLGPKKDKAGW